MKRLQPFLAVLAAVSVIVGVWILATPPSGGPDEPAHVIRGAALVRGQLDGEPISSLLDGFEVPAHVGFPDPGCFAFQPEVPATCATDLEPPTGTTMRTSRSSDYPIWGHLAGGLGSFLPAAWSSTGARIADAVLPVLLLAGAMFAASRRGWAAAGGVLLAVTVPVWFIIAVVNPSGLLIAGGIALWGALANGSREPSGWRPSRLDGVLLAGGWVAMTMPRRDGLIYAVLVMSLAILIFDIGVDQLRRGISRSAWIAIAASTAVTLAWAASSSTTSSQSLLLAPFAPVVAIVGRRLWRQVAQRAGTPGRVLFAAAATAVALAGSVAVMSTRAAGFDVAVLQRAISQTGIDLRESIGVFGWLDTALPQSMVFLWVIALGLLVAGGVIAVRQRALIGASVILGVAVWASWVLTLVQNDETGTYWQGRYYLPLLVGIPIVLSTAGVGRAHAIRLAKSAALISLVVANVGLAAGMRRWAVGQNGSMMPWRWDTYGTVVAPAVLLGVHAVGTMSLWRVVANLAGPADRVADAVEPAGGGLARADRCAPDGVNLLGYHQSASGLGVAVRQLHASFIAAGVAVSTFEVAQTDSPQLVAASAADAQIVRRTTIAVVTAPELPAALSQWPQLQDVERVVGYWFWELAGVPDAHRAGLELVDEIWAPTDFVAAAYRSVPDGPPVVHQPMHLSCPDLDENDRAAWRRRIAPNDEFVFLVTLDLFSIVERKNPFGAIDAFAAAFDSGDSTVRLVIKTLNGEQRPESMARITEHVRRSGMGDRIEVFDAFVSDADMAALLAAADCVVSLHRSEGLGLHLAAAMWLETPVIASRYSGNLDFMSDESAALVDVVMIDVERGEGAYPAGFRWADPDVAQAAAWMTRLVGEPDVRGRLVAGAAQRMREQQSEEALGRGYAQALAGPLRSGY